MSIPGVTQEGLINQMSGFFAVVDLNSKFLCVNEMGAQWTGFKSPELMIGLSYADVKCRAADDADLFLHHDQLVKERGIFRFIGYYCYAGDDWKIIVGERFLLKDNQNAPIGMAIHFNDFTHCRLIDINRFLIDHPVKYCTKNTRKQLIYSIENYYPETQLSERQSECLFFLLRGKTTKEVAHLLNLSPRTVESYINEIKFKLQCNTKSQLIEKAIHSGYLNIIPTNVFQSSSAGF